MKKIYLITLIFPIVLFVSCSTSYQEETIILPERTISVLPIIFGAIDENYVTYQDIKVLTLMSYIIKQELNITITYDKIYYSSEFISIEYCDIIDAILIQNINVSEIIQGEKIVIFLQYQNQCQNLLGCGEYQGILKTYRESRLWSFLSDKIMPDVSVLLHELAHVLGANHVDDDSLMNPFMDDVDNISFSDITKNQINECLDMTNL